MFLACSVGSRRAKFASFHETAEGERPIARASSISCGFALSILPKGILQ